MSPPPTEWLSQVSSRVNTRGACSSTRVTGKRWSQPPAPRRELDRHAQGRHAQHNSRGERSLPHLCRALTTMTPSRPLTLVCVAGLALSVVNAP